MCAGDGHWRDVPPSCIVTGNSIWETFVDALVQK